MSDAFSAQEWQPGDRLANVRMRGADDARLTLHGDFAGTPLWLACIDDATAADGLPTCAPPERGIVLSSEVLAVPEGWRSFAVDAAWRALAGENVLWRTDANLRLRTRQRLPLVAGAMPTDAPDAHPHRAMPMTAPILLIPDVFEAALCERLVSHLEVDCGGGDESGVLVYENGSPRFQLDPSVKRRRESPPRDAQLEQWMHERVSRRVLPEIARVFQFQAQRRDPFKLLAYAADAGYFRAHRDNETPDVAHRRFALSINLDAGQYEGGEFRFPEFGPRTYAPETGGAIVFSCSLLHEVLPVMRGTRHAMTTFLA